MKTPLEVRPVEPGDFIEWRRLWDGYNAFYGRAGPTALPREVTDMTWRRFLDDGEPVHALAAVKDAAVVGIAHFVFHRSTTSIEPTCYLQDLLVDEDARGAGVGRALIDGVCDHARKRAGASRVYWLTHETNHTAMALYDRVADRPGFVLYRRLT